MSLRAAAMATAAAFLLAACGGRAGSREAPVAVVARPIADRPPDAARTSPPTAWVEVAADPDARSRGLGGRAVLRPDCGMLFVYPDAAERHFWMKDCVIPLDAAFLDPDGRVLAVAEMAPPPPGTGTDRLPRHPSGGAAMYVLEMRGGWMRAAGVTPGCRIDVTAALRGVVVR